MEPELHNKQNSTSSKIVIAIIVAGVLIWCLVSICLFGISMLVWSFHPQQFHSQSIINRTPLWKFLLARMAAVCSEEKFRDHPKLAHLPGLSPTWMASQFWNEMRKMNISTGILKTDLLKSTSKPGTTVLIIKSVTKWLSIVNKEYRS